MIFKILSNRLVQYSTIQSMEHHWSDVEGI